MSKEYKFVPAIRLQLTNPHSPIRVRDPFLSTRIGKYSRVAVLVYCKASRGVKTIQRENANLHPAKTLLTFSHHNIGDEMHPFALGWQRTKR